MLDILKVNALYTKGKYIIQESMVPEKKISFITFQRYFTVSNTEYELEMITGLDDMINFCQKFCKSIIISKFLFASF